MHLHSIHNLFHNFMYISSHIFLTIMSEHFSRSTDYPKEEDQLVCQVYLKNFQDPIKSIHQTSYQFWNRVLEIFVKEKI